MLDPDPDWIRIQQNIRIRIPRLKHWTCQYNQRRHFFSNQVIDSWNKIPNAVKNVESVSERGYKNHRAAMVTPTWMEPDRRQDGGADNNRMQTLSERPQRGQWEIINK